METKTSKATTLLRSGNLKEALSIFRTFRIGFTKEERRILQIADEVLSGNASLYQQIGIDATKEVEKSLQLLFVKYLYSNKLNKV